MHPPDSEIRPPRPARRPTRRVAVGSLGIGGFEPILIQSMTVTDTMDTEGVVREVRELVEAGCPLVRLTAPSLREAENLREIRRRLAGDGIRVPMVADIHFTPNAALIAAEIVEKVRINPGNYADKKRFAVREYTDREYQDELSRLADRFRPLVRKLKENGAALRIGTNHGSLSDRILNRYGDTPEGMVESALEFVRICEEEDYFEIVLSMKSSVPGVMIAAYRLLVRRMADLDMEYPLHLGVTEAGDGLEARIKSAVGIGALLADGIGDTIRVSLAEDSRHEIPAARAILQALERERPAGQTGEVNRAARIDSAREWPATDTSRPRRRTAPWVLDSLVIGGDAPVRVEERILPASQHEAPDPGAPEQGSEFLSWRVASPGEPTADAVLLALEHLRPGAAGKPILLEWEGYRPSDIHVLEPVLQGIDGISLALDQPERMDPEKLRLLARLLVRRRRPVRWRIPASSPAESADLALRLSDLCHEEGLNTIGFLPEPGPGWIARVRSVAASLDGRPDLLFLEVPAFGPDPAVLAGSILNDGLGDALCLNNDVPARAGEPWPAGGRQWTEEPVSSAYGILQACRLRLTRPEYIACPSCGRTQFDLQSTTRRIRERTGHLAGVKIAIMGCIVNGPGEMADADFGYVGSGPSRVDLYVGREKVRANVPEAEAADRLVELIRAHGRWSDPAC